MVVVLLFDEVLVEGLEGVEGVHQEDDVPEEVGPVDGGVDFEDSLCVLFYGLVGVLFQFYVVVFGGGEAELDHF